MLHDPGRNLSCAIAGVNVRAGRGMSRHHDHVGVQNGAAQSAVPKTTMRAIRGLGSRASGKPFHPNHSERFRKLKGFGSRHSNTGSRTRYVARELALCWHPSKTRQRLNNRSDIPGGFGLSLLRQEPDTTFPNLRVQTRSDRRHIHARSALRSVNLPPQQMWLPTLRVCTFEGWVLRHPHNLVHKGFSQFPNLRKSPFMW